MGGRPPHGWATGVAAGHTPAKNTARPHLPHTVVGAPPSNSAGPSDLNGPYSSRQAAAPPPSQPTRKPPPTPQQAVNEPAVKAAVAAPEVAVADVVLVESDGVHKFSAYVLANFEATVIGVELSVAKGEWVTVVVDDDDVPIFVQELELLVELLHVLLFRPRKIVHDPNDVVRNPGEDLVEEGFSHLSVDNAVHAIILALRHSRLHPR